MAAKPSGASPPPHAVEGPSAPTAHATAAPRRRATDPQPQAPSSALAPHAAASLSEPAQLTRARTGLVVAVGGAPDEVRAALARWSDHLEGGGGRELGDDLQALARSMRAHGPHDREARRALAEATRVTVEVMAREAGVRIVTRALDEGAVVASELRGGRGAAARDALQRIEQTLRGVAHELHRGPGASEATSELADLVLARLHARAAGSASATRAAGRQDAALRAAYDELAAALTRRLDLPAASLETLATRLRSGGSAQLTADLQRFAGEARALLQREGLGPNGRELRAHLEGQAQAAIAQGRAELEGRVRTELAEARAQLDRARAELRSALESGRELTATLRFPIDLDDGRGNRFVLAQGSSISVSAGKLTLRSPATELARRDGPEIIAKDTRIELQRAQADAFFGRLRVSDGPRTFSLTNGHLTLREGGASLVADHMHVTWPRGEVELSNARIVVPDREHASVSATNARVVENDRTWTADRIQLDLYRRAGGAAATRRLRAEGLHYAHGRTDLRAAEADLQWARAADGARTVSLDSRDLRGTIDGRTLESRGSTRVAVRYDGDGARRSMELAGDDVRLRDTDGRTLAVQRGAAELQLRPDGSLERASVRAGALDYSGRAGEGVRVIGEGASLVAARAPDGSGTLVAEAQRLEVRANGTTTRATGATANVELGADNRLRLAEVSAATFVHERAGSRLAIEGGQLRLARDGDLSTLQASVGTGTFEGGFGRLRLTGGSELRLVQDGRQIREIDGRVSSLDFTDGRRSVALEGGRITAASLDGKRIDRLDVRMDRLDYRRDDGGELAAGRDLQLTLQRRSDGGATALFNGRELAGAAQGTAAAFSDLRLRVDTDARGRVTALDAQAPGDVSVRRPDLVATGRDVQLQATDTAARLYVGEAHLVRQVQDAVGQDLRVRDLELGITRGEHGGLRSLDLSVNNLQARTQWASVGVTNPDGHRLRVQVRADDDGRTVREVLLDLPHAQSSLVVATDDVRVRLGQQSTRLTRDPATGVVRLVGQGTNADVFWRDGEVRFASASADVALDGGRLVLNDLRGATARVRTAGAELELDIAHIKQQMVSLGRFQGADAEGLSLVLAPTGDGSTISARAAARIGGTPVSLEVRDARAFSAGGVISPNQVRFWAVDPSGQGRIVSKIGPLELESENGAIRGMARYHTFDSGRLLRAMGDLFKATHGDRNAVLTEDALVLRAALPPPSDKGSLRPHLGASLLLPHDGGMTRPLTDTVPQAGVGLALGQSSRLGAPGVMLETGVGYRSGDGVLYQGMVYGGLVPGSFGHFEMQQGTAKVYGVPLREAAVPTTAAVGVTLRRDDGRSSASLGVGVHDNVARHVSSRFLVEPAGPGVHVQGAYCEGQLCFNAGVSATRRADGTTDYGVRGGLQFKF